MQAQYPRLDNFPRPRILLLEYTTVSQPQPCMRVTERAICMVKHVHTAASRDVALIGQRRAIATTGYKRASQEGAYICVYVFLVKTLIIIICQGEY